MADQATALAWESAALARALVHVSLRRGSHANSFLPDDLGTSDAIRMALRRRKEQPETAAQTPAELYFEALLNEKLSLGMARKAHPESYVTAGVRAWLRSRHKWHLICRPEKPVYRLPDKNDQRGVTESWPSFPFARAR